MDRSKHVQETMQFLSKIERKKERRSSSQKWMYFATKSVFTFFNFILKILQVTNNLLVFSIDVKKRLQIAIFLLWFEFFHGVLFLENPIHHDLCVQSFNMSLLCYSYNNGKYMTVCLLCQWKQLKVISRCSVLVKRKESNEKGSLRFLCVINSPSEMKLIRLP